MNAREAAMTVLYETERKQAYLNYEFQNPKYCEVPSAEFAFFKDLVFGTWRRRITLDYEIRRHTKQRLKKIDPKILALLRVAVYQIYFSDNVPDHAVCNESVKIAKRTNPKTAGFVNAVLRSVIREHNENDTIVPNTKDTVEHYSIAYSCPTELTRFFVNIFGTARAKAFLEHSLTAPPLCVRVNTMCADREILAKKLTDAGAKAEAAPLCDSALFLTGADEAMRKSFLREITVQDQSAQLAAFAVAPEPGQTVIDLCAAPGGKSTHMAEIMQNRGVIYACDLYEARAESIRLAAERLHMDMIRPQTADARVFRAEWENKADCVLADVPCSGLGIIRRKPDIKYKENITDFRELIAVQREILETAHRYVKAGGVLVYATCTVNPSENQETVYDFLKKHPNFTLDPIPQKHLGACLHERAQTGMITLMPDTDYTDGFFICRMKRRAE